MRSFFIVSTLLTFASTTALASTGLVSANPTGDQLVCGVVAFLIVGGLALWLGSSTDILRDSQPVDFGGAKSSTGKKYRRTYSLAQSQMTWWFSLIIASFVFIACTREVIDGILVKQSLILMGIGTGTAIGAAIIEQVKQNSPPNPAKPSTLDQFQRVLDQIQAAGEPAPQAMIDARDELAEQLASKNFLSDILTDIDGISLHRFQSVAWTLVLGIFFVVNVFTTLTMPQFDDLLLATIGISGATYLGFKIPEQPS